MAEIPKNRLNSALDIPRTTCRLFSRSEKLRVVEAADRCTKPDTRPVNWGCCFDARVLFRRTWPTGVDGVCEFTQRFLPKISRQLMARFVQIRHEKQRLERENARPWKSRWRAAPLRSRLRLCEWPVP